MELAVAYTLWALGPFSPALHLLYVGRDDQWAAWCCTGGGFVLGWVRDAWRLPAYVALRGGAKTSAEMELHKVRMNHSPVPSREYILYAPSPISPISPGQLGDSLFPETQAITVVYI